MSKGTRHTQVRAQSLGWVRWKDLQTGRWMEPIHLFAMVRGAVCVFPPGVDKLIWVPEWCVRPVTQDEDPNSPSASGDDSGNSSRIMSDGESGEKPHTFNAS